MSNLKIAIVGAGAVGGYLAGKLIHHHYDVTLVANGRHLTKISSQGLKVIEYKEDNFTVYPYVVESLTDDDIYDVIFIATKSCDYQSACESIKDAVDINTLIVPLSDGLGVSSTLKKYLPSCIIGDGLIHVITEQTSPGVIHRKSFTFYLQIACKKENVNLKILEQLLNHCDLKTSTQKSLQYERWRKYLFTSTMSILTTYFEKPMGYIFKEELDLMLDILLEIKKVANAKNVDITSKDIEKTVNQASHVPYETKTTMQIEFENKDKTEFDLLAGYVVKEAQALNIAIPKMQKIYDNLNSRLV